jgi:hypothetical protein
VASDLDSEHDVGGASRIPAPATAAVCGRASGADHLDERPDVPVDDPGDVAPELLTWQLRIGGQFLDKTVKDGRDEFGDRVREASMQRYGADHEGRRIVLLHKVRSSNLRRVPGLQHQQ